MPVSQSYEAINTVIQSLVRINMTALGPGMLAAVALAAEGKPGSQVILCTDGLANYGLGRLDSILLLEDSNAFYRRVAEYAKSKGVTIHIVTIIGAQCNIDAISVASEITGGMIERVDPANMRTNFEEFLASPVLATNVILKVKLHKGLEFRNELPENMTENSTVLIKDFGNVTEDTEITFEYRIKHVKELLALKIDLTTIKSFSF